MPQSIPVDHDPFADEKEAPGTSVPVEGDPFAQESAAEPSQTWDDVASSAVGNALPSAGRFVSDIYQAARHPVDTATSLGRMAIGAAQKTGLIASDQEDYRPYADAVGQYFKERYGSMDNFKQSMSEDPVGVLGDLSMVLTGGGGAMVRGSAYAGRLGEVARVAGRGAEIAGKYTNLLTPAVAVAAPVAKGIGHLASELSGVQTGTGGLSLRTAAAAGYSGGEDAKAFREHLRGKAPMSDPVDDAREAVRSIREGRGKDYVDAMSNIDDTNPLDFKDIDDAFSRSGNIRQFKGVSLSDSTQDFRNRLGDTLSEWRNLDPAQYHTAAGLDALKKKIWEDFWSRAEAFSPESKIAGDVYNAVKRTIMKQSPEYGGIMNKYEEAEKQLSELERTLSLKNGATMDTALRNLQSVLRDNVNTNFGQRRALAEYLVQNGSPQLMEKLAGQSLNTMMPRGLPRFAASIGAHMAAILGTSAIAHPAFLAMAPMMAMASPRLMGEASYLAGRAARPLKYVPPGTASAARAISPYTQATDDVEPEYKTPSAAVAPAAPSSANVRGALPVAGSEFGQSGVSGVGGTMKGAAILSTGVGGSREDIGKHYANYQNFGAMSPQEQKAALAALHGDTNISINERKRLEKMMMDRGRGPALPEGVPPGSRAQRSDSTGLVRWLAPDGTIYSPSGNLAH